ncbi:MAG: hypothetical protein HKN25_04660 [Pyrinomonadaceae bacterium]|nr:hypothetical protein [Pyrinomonadaceae bacterium]
MRVQISFAIAISIVFLTSAFTVFAQDCTSAGICNEAGSIRRVRNTSYGNYEYVIFSIKRPIGNLSYTVEDASGPFTEDPSDRPIFVRGSKHKRIRFQSVYWMCSIREKLSLPNAAVKGIENTSQFEGQVEYVVGISDSASYITTYHYDVGMTRNVVMKFKKCP